MKADDYKWLEQNFCYGIFRCNKTSISTYLKSINWKSQIITSFDKPLPYIE